MDAVEKKRILDELGGIPEEVYDSLVEDLIEQLKEKKSELRAAVSGNDSDAVSSLAHSLKGASGNLRISEVQVVAREIEYKAKEPDSSERTFEELLDELDKVSERLEKSFS